MVEPREPNTVPTPEQFLAEFDALPHGDRVEQATQLLDALARASRCWVEQHDPRLGNLRQLDTMRSYTTIVCPDCSQRVQVPLHIAPQRAGAIIELRISVPQDAATNVFVEHVRSAMADHPTFVIRDDADSGQ